MEQTTILLSKLIPPVPSSSFMRRPSLNKLLKKSSDAKLTLLHSGAGYGKSSSLAQYFLDSRLLYSWYTVTAEDDDVLPFLRHLQLSIQRVLPDFGERLFTHELPSAFPKEEELRQWHTRFTNSLFDIKQPLYIILDDYHLVDHVFQINYIMEKLIEFLPPHVHIIVATRHRPKWASLSKLKLNNALNEITETHFSFSEEEISVYFEDFFGKVISKEEAQAIIELTEGWAIAINLLARQTETLQSGLPDKPALQDLFAYLTEEVFNNMSKEEQTSLLSFSIFPTFTESLIGDFYGYQEAEKLKALADRHVFIQPLREDGTYRFHALFQQFLKNKWIQQDKEGWLAAHRRATEYHIKKGNSTFAIDHALKTDDVANVAATLLATAPSFIRSGQFDLVIDIMKELPETLKSKSYSLYYYEGESHRYRAYYEKARQSYMKCLDLAQRENDLVYISRANAGLAHIYLDTIQPGLAEPYLIDALSSAVQTDAFSKKEMDQLKRQFAENLVNLGRASEAAEFVKTEKLDETILIDGNLDARILLRTGQLVEAEQLLKSRTTEYRLPDSHRETEILLSFVSALIGKAEQAKESADHGIAIGQKEKSGFVEAVGNIRKGHAEYLINPFDLGKAEQLYEKAIQQMDELNVSRGKAEPLLGLAIVKARMGQSAEGIQLALEGLRETEKVNDRWLSGLIRIGLSIIYSYDHNFDDAIAVAKEAERIFVICGDHYSEMITSFWLARAYLLKEDQEGFIEHINRCTSLCNEYKYGFFFNRDTVFGPFDREIFKPILLKAYQLNEEHSGIQFVYQNLELEGLTSHPGYRLYVNLLGPFELQIGKEVVGDRKWQRDKAKELFIFLLLNRGRFAAKEEIMSVLWKDSDLESADRDFKVALNALLKVLEPNRGAREESFFIQRKQTMYRLNPAASIITDLDLFTTYGEKGMEERDAKKAKEFLTKAVDRYKGNLFEEKSTLDWLEDDRRNLEETFLTILERLAQTSTRLKEFGNTIHWAEKLLKIDRTWEEAYRLLMFAHYQQHNRSLAVKWYERCVQVLQDELNIEPMETTEQMYDMIVSVVPETV
ncbi:BTAD domain-containing putative transcriptional regulator [Chungangia koreensis]|uniref:BTAD domain-containing putative transcriptional regulator n=1 Tax=Chungangia koreensis TaxID=752657 RepID=A0ABV8X8E4_9LACT